ncbi:MAG: hypothetical protein ACUVV3_07700 [Dehalococcoidia bacterium]
MMADKERPSIARLVAWAALSLIALSTLPSVLGMLYAAEAGLIFGILAILLVVLAVTLAICALAYLWRELRRLDRWLFRG